MSASNTNVKKQQRRHRGPLFGITFALIWAAVLFAGLLIWTSYQTGSPAAESPAQAVSE